ncbi:MAG: SIS domain-containing protein [Meiothermus sp.]|nr:SIS domain-containing protein [Meiothermus sp.]
MSLEQYTRALLNLLHTVSQSEEASMRKAAAWIADALSADGLLYTFGTGHSQLLACEAFYRAGGLAPVSVMLEGTVGLEPGAVASSFLERTTGYGALVAERYPIGPRDVLMVFSNSAANAVPLEVARAVKARGAKVVAVISRRYAEFKGSAMFEIADLILDNHAPPGDAVIPVGDAAVGPVSTVAGAYILNAVLSEVAALLGERGEAVPLYLSSNMPGAPEHNARLVERFRPRIRHL